LHLTSWEEGAKGPEGKSKLVKGKSLKMNLEMLRPGKNLLSKKQEGPEEIIKQDLIRG
jgi:hypothetical protein